MRSWRSGAVAQWRRTNILLNAAGHNVPGTMLAARGPISDLFIEACHQANDFYRLVRCSQAEHPAAKAATKILVLGLQIELARSHGERILLNATGPNVLLRSEPGVWTDDLGSPDEARSGDCHSHPG